MRAFTLVELLVVVTIIVILIALLTPGLDRAVKMAEDVQCATNLRSVGMGLGLYLMDHKHRYPQTSYFGMLLGNRGAVGYQGNNLDVTQRPLNVYLGYASDGGTVPVARCPLDNGDALVGSNNAYRDWGNSYIEFTWRDWYRFKRVFGGLTHHPDPLNPANTSSIRSTSLPRMDNKALLADWPIFGDRSYSDLRTRWHNEDTGEFDRQFSTLFADSHVELFTYPRSEIEYPDGTMHAPNASFLWY